MKHKYRAVAVLAAGLAGLTNSLHAQEAGFHGSMNGCFYAAAETGCPPIESSSNFFLTVLASKFNIKTAGIGAAPGTPHASSLALPVTATPEPSSLALMATGLAGCAVFLRKRRRNT